jgi:hypothetical protein
LLEPGDARIEILEMAVNFRNVFHRVNSAFIVGPWLRASDHESIDQRFSCIFSALAANHPCPSRHARLLCRLFAPSVSRHQTHLCWSSISAVLGTKLDHDLLYVRVTLRELFRPQMYMHVRDRDRRLTNYEWTRAFFPRWSDRSCLSAVLV